MNTYYKWIALSAWLVTLPFPSAADNSAGAIFDVVMPARVLAPSAKIDVDWEIDDINDPRTPFAKAVSGKLAAIGVSRTISVTYELPSHEGALYSFEAYEFSQEISLSDAFDKLKPGVLGLGSVDHKRINDFPALAVEISPEGPAVWAVLAGETLFVLGVPNTVTADLPWFIGKYFEWHASRSE